jgi:hypothetical protein
MYCDIGFMNAAGTTCQLKCDAGEYPVVVWVDVLAVDYEQNENQIASTTCSTCPSTCLTCLGADAANDCTSCVETEYLAITDPKR